MMKKQLIVLAPQLKVSSEEVSKLMKILAKQQIEIDKVRTTVAADEAVAKVLFFYKSAKVVLLNFSNLHT